MYIIGFYLTADDRRMFLINLIVRNGLLLAKMSPWSFIIYDIYLSELSKTRTLRVFSEIWEKDRKFEIENRILKYILFLNY